MHFHHHMRHECLPFPSPSIEFECTVKYDDLPHSFSKLFLSRPHAFRPSPRPRPSPSFLLEGPDREDNNAVKRCDNYLVTLSILMSIPFELIDINVDE